MRERLLSQKNYAASCALIPGGVNSPVRAFPGLDMTPLVAFKGAGSRVWDLDGYSYIDFCGSWGALILGHAHPAVVEAAHEQLKRGSTFGISTPFEEAIARCVITHIPSIEKVRFVSSGTEATMTAVRLARGYTHKNVIVKFDGNYHGHADGFLVNAGSGVTNLNLTSSSKGIPSDLVKNTVSLPYNDIETCRQFLRTHKDVAAVLLEPIAGNMGVVPASQAFIEMLRVETTNSSSLLIFDEVMSGFRVGLHGAQALYGIHPDLTCLGKIVGGGFPAAAFGGKREIMDCLAPLGEVYQAGTLSGNPVAMQAGLATLQEIEKPGFYEELERKTNLLTKPIQEKINRNNIPACINQVGSMFTLFLDIPMFPQKPNLMKRPIKLFLSIFLKRGFTFLLLLMRQLLYRALIPKRT
ncbi:MAG: glutamate-1-semialdehyde 2,1-aminomutase [Rhabdochlamydiaceae bacterium]|jgi:glutamate-1-semialdehyde 2,1-aminomutase